mmetsp:Transcript_24381/g.57785  ORF Transcript_24381/g.57785 Transcript_24381/m.57785 type:complete len:241 (-) Transcript_24381:41-763(-)
MPPGPHSRALDFRLSSPSLRTASRSRAPPAFLWAPVLRHEATRGPRRRQSALLCCWSTPLRPGRKPSCGGPQRARRGGRPPSCHVRANARKLPRPIQRNVPHRGRFCCLGKLHPSRDTMARLPSMAQQASRALLRAASGNRPPAAWESAAPRKPAALQSFPGAARQPQSLFSASPPPVQRPHPVQEWCPCRNNGSRKLSSLCTDVAAACSAVASTQELRPKSAVPPQGTAGRRSVAQTFP